MISLWIAWNLDYCMEQYVLLHDVSVISTPVQGTMLMTSSCQLTLLFRTLAFKACLENLRQTLSDVCEREGITNVTVSSPTISPSFLSLLQCSGCGGAMLSSPSTILLFLHTTWFCCAFQSQCVQPFSGTPGSWGLLFHKGKKLKIRGIYIPLRLLLSNNKWVQATLRAGWGYPPQDRAWGNTAAWLSPLFHPTLPVLSGFPWEHFFNKSLSRQILISGSVSGEPD